MWRLWGVFVFWIYFESRAQHNFLAYGLSDVEESTQKYKLGQIYIYIYIYIYIHIYTYIYTYSHTHTHTHISISDNSKVHYRSCGSSCLSILMQPPLLCFSNEPLDLENFYFGQRCSGIWNWKSIYFCYTKVFLEP